MVPSFLMSLWLIRKIALMYCLHRLGDAFASLSAKKEPVLSGNSRITQILADSLGNTIVRLILCSMCVSVVNMLEIFV